MSQMFDNYKNRQQTETPDNQKDYILLPNEYKDILIIGADNTHDFKIPHPKDEIKRITILYNQGIETKLQYRWPSVAGYSEIYFDYDNELATYVSYEISAADTFKFNNYNKDVKVQAEIVLNDRTTADNVCIDISEVYKIKLVPKLEKYFRPENEDDEKQILDY